MQEDLIQIWFFHLAKDENNKAMTQYQESK